MISDNMRRAETIVLVGLVSCLFMLARSEAGILDPKQVTQQPANLTQAERALVAGSRQAITVTGISEAYFDRHISLMKVVNQPGDRRVV